MWSRQVIKSTSIWQSCLSWQIPMVIKIYGNEIGALTKLLGTFSPLTKMPGQFAQNFIEQCVERHWKVRFRSGFNGPLDGFGKSAPDFLTVASLFSQIISPHFILSFVSLLSGMLKIAGPTLRTAYFNLQIFCSSTHYLHNEYHLSCLSKASLARQAHRSDICYLGQLRQLQCRPRVRSGCGWILWSHIQFFPRRLMFSFWTRQLSRAGDVSRWCMRDWLTKKASFDMPNWENERPNELGLVGPRR